MIKKVMVLGCVVGMLAGMASMANAAEANWLTFLRASNASNAAASADAQIGQQATASSAAYPSGTPGAANCVMGIGWAPISGSLYQWKMLTTTATYAQFPDTVNLFAYCGADYTDSKIYIRMWAPTSGLQNQRTWTLKTEDGTVLWSGKFAVGTSASAALCSVNASPNGVKMILTSASAVPEPGSMVAMLSGLVGLAGFGIRRRK